MLVVKKEGILCGRYKMEMRCKVFRRHMSIRPTLIIVCNRCGGLFLAAEEQKTKTCPYCGSCVDVRRAKKVAAAESAFEASEILRDIKSRKGFSRE
jgi:DNA-directed RNA polymerase subunit RPC12/RpoP